ncbi:hypothetical protein ABPG75_007954 [Micractinium tetrahymenae]
MHLRPAGGSAPIPGFPPGPLAEVLVMWHSAGAHPDGAASMQCIRSAIGLASNPTFRPALSTQLAALATTPLPAGAPPQRQRLTLTADQMLYELHCRLVEVADIVAAPVAPTWLGPDYILPAGAAAAASAAADASAAAAMQLQPHNPKSLQHLATHAAFKDRARSADAALRLHALGKQQRCNYWIAQGAATAATSACAVGHGVRPEVVAAAQAAFADVQPALKRCRKLLPEA